MGVMYETVDSMMTCSRFEDVDAATSLTAMCSNGVAEIAVFIRDSDFSDLENISALIPEPCSADVAGDKKSSQSMFFFSIPCSESDTAFCDEATLCPDDTDEGQETADDIEDDFYLFTDAVGCTHDHQEDFEMAGMAESWENGVESNSDLYGNFLGRLGGLSENRVTKTFHIASECQKASIEFKLYSVNQVEDATAEFRIGVQGSSMTVDMSSLGDLQSFGDPAVTQSGKSADEVTVLVQADDYGFLINMKVPSSWWKFHGFEVPLSFTIETDKDLDEESYGIDDFKMTLECERRLDGELNDEDAAEEGFYCSAKEFPCGDDQDMVHVCHYSSRLGYQTYCVPEEDSDVIRFYGSDYCGPCVGGFGGIHFQ